MRAWAQTWLPAITRRPWAFSSCNAFKFFTGTDISSFFGCPVSDSNFKQYWIRFGIIYNTLCSSFISRLFFFTCVCVCVYIYNLNFFLHFPHVAEWWHPKINLTWSNAPSPSRGVRKGTDIRLRWRWVRLCSHVTPITVGSWVWDSCWNGWTPQPACLVGKHGQLWLKCKKTAFVTSNCFLPSECIKSLSFPIILKVWCLLLDALICLNSAERHAGCSCITASVDDIHFEHTIG